jgi:hypothetical protein
MVVVLLLAAALAIWGGLFLKRRARRLRAADPSVLGVGDVAPALADRHPGAHSGSVPVLPPPTTPTGARGAGGAGGGGGYPSVTDVSSSQLYRPRTSSLASARGLPAAGAGSGAVRVAPIGAAGAVL